MNIEVQENGIKCDSCDWKDTTVKLSELVNWVNKSCPKCGANLLTEEDYNNAMIVEKAIHLINSIQNDELNTELDLSSVKKRLECLGIKGVENIEDLDKFIDISINTHEKIEIKIEKSKDNDLGLER